MRIAAVLLTLTLLSMFGCRRKRRQAPTPQSLTAIAPVAVAAAEEAVEPVDPDELLPGSSIAFGLTLPAASNLRVSSDETRMYYVPARMPQVMRYLQRRLDFGNADIQPLGAMIRGARLHGSEAATLIDVGVRDEGDKTLLTLWNRTPIVGAPQRSLDDALRAAGYDPQTRRLQNRYNR